MVESMHFAWFCHLQAAAYIIDYLGNAVWMYAFTKSRHFTENRGCVAIGGETSDKDILTLRCQTGPKNRRTGYCHARSVNQQLINSWLQEVISLLNDITKQAKFKIFLEVGKKRQILTVLQSIKEKPDVDYGNSRNYWKPLFTGQLQKVFFPYSESRAFCRRFSSCFVLFSYIFHIQAIHHL